MGQLWQVQLTATAAASTISTNPGLDPQASRVIQKINFKKILVYKNAHPNAENAARVVESSSSMTTDVGGKDDQSDNDSGMNLVQK